MYFEVPGIIHSNEFRCIFNLHPGGLSSSSLFQGSLMFIRYLFCPLMFVGSLIAQTSPAPTIAPDSLLDTYLAQYAPHQMTFDASSYSPKEKDLLQKLVQASIDLDTVFWLQTSRYGLHLRDSLTRNQTDGRSAKLLTLVKRNGGPYELLNDNAAFMGDVPYYAGHEFYPSGMTAEQFDAYVNTLPEAERAAFMSPYTVIRTDEKGGYRAVPFHEEYKYYIERIARTLQEAADLSENRSFADFLRLKARALQTDEYFDADVAWIEMEGSKFDMVFGPFETYADGIKGVKAKYEANIEIVDQEESKKLEIYTGYLQKMEENLPIPAEYKSEVKGLTAKFVIVRDIIRAGESPVGYQAVATNLPNDPLVHEKKGTKKTFWKNMFEARFNTIIKPVSLRLVDEQQRSYLSDQGFFQFVLMHEICHAVGPRTVKVGPNKGMAVNASIGPAYSALEEAKADISGLHSLIYLMKEGVVDKAREREFFVSYLGSLFRSIRFGLNQAHGKAAWISLNYFKEQGGVVYDGRTNTWMIDFGKFPAAVSMLATELLVLEGDGDPVRVADFFEEWTVETPEIRSSLDAVKDLPIDVMPQYSIKWE